MARPVLLLDIDGVLNAISPSPPDTFPADDWLRFHANDPAGGSWRMQISQSVVDWLKDIHADGRAEIRWHTTWQEGALDIGDKVGLPTFPVVDAPETNWNPIEMRKQWWKTPAAFRVVRDEGRRLIWVDDDISYHLAPSDSHLLKTARRNGVFLVSPRTATGLCPRDMGQINFALESWEKEDAATTAPSGDTAAAAASAAEAR